MVRLIKRYGSRKLYDTEESRYVSLEQIAEWVREGQEIKVVDNRSQDDVTAQTLTQVILDEGKRGSSLPTEMLHQLIRQGGDVVSTGVKQINKTADRLLQAGVDRLPPLRQVREETDMLRKRLEELESSLLKFETSGAARRATETETETETEPETEEEIA